MMDQGAIDRGMQAQFARFREALARGMPRLGWKIGINDPAMLERLGLERSVIGWLAGDRALPAGGTYGLRRGTRVAVEAEVAIRVGGGGTVAALAPAIELVNYSVPASDLEGILAHDIFHDAVVIGRETLPIPIVDGEWPELVRNGTAIARRDPALLVLQPAQVIRLVADTLTRYGERLLPGDWIIAGSLVRPAIVHAGDRLDVDFGPLGNVAVAIDE